MARGAGLPGRSGLMLLGALALGLIGGGVWYAGRGPVPGPTPGPMLGTPPVPAAPVAQTPETPPAGQAEPSAAAETPAEAEPPAVPATPEDSAASDPAPETRAAETAAETAAEADPAPEAVPTPEQGAPEPAPEPASEPALPPLAAPTFDVVRVEPDGTALVAGRAAPHARLRLMLNGQEIGEAQAGADGTFAAFLTLEPGAQARVLTLLAELDGREAVSEDQIILAPVAPVAPSAPPPVQLAEAETRPEPEPSPAPQPALSEADPAAATPAPAPAAPPPAPQTAEAETGADPAAAPEAQAEPEAQPEPEAQAEPAPAIARISQEPEPPAPDAAAPAPTGSQTAPAPAVLAAVEAQTRDPSVAPAPKGEAAQAPAAGGASAALPEAAAEAPPEAPTEAPGAVAVLRAGRDGIELLQPASPRRPEAMAQIALDAIGYSERGEVQLSGRAQGGSVVRVYLDNTAVADLDAAENGTWQGQITGVAPGIYTLRLDELGQGGRVLSRIETPFKRESPEVLRPPAPEGAPDHAPLIRAVTVQKGDTLWAISRTRYGDGLLYVRVFQANREAIRNPDLIYPGQVFALPD